MNALTQIFTETAKRIPAPGTDYMVIGKRFRPGLPPVFCVLFEGRHYTVNHHLLIALRRGVTPLELELEPDEIDEEMM